MDPIHGISRADLINLVRAYGEAEHDHGSALQAWTAGNLPWTELEKPADRTVETFRAVVEALYRPRLD